MAQIPFPATCPCLRTVWISWPISTDRLEGNTYTQLDTRELIEWGKAARGKATLETQMILNHKVAIELLVENVFDGVYRPLSTPQPIEDMLDILLGKANEIADPFEQSFFMMVHLFGGARSLSFGMA